MLSLNRKAESVLLEAGVANPYLYVEAADVDSLEIHGIVSTKAEKEMVEDVLRKIKGVKRVENNLEVNATTFPQL